MGDRTATRRTTPANDETVGATGDVTGDATGRLGLAVMRLARRLRQETPPGLTPSQFSALAVVGHGGPITITDLAAIENVQPPTISRLVGSLEDGGWIERVADPSDRRVTRVRATPKAQRELARVRSERNAYLGRRLAALDPDDLAAVLAALHGLEQLSQSEDR